MHIITEKDIKEREKQYIQRNAYRKKNKEKEPRDIDTKLTVHR